MTDTPIPHTPNCQYESEQLSEALEECVRTFTQEHQKLKPPNRIYLAKRLELHTIADKELCSLPPSPTEEQLRMFRSSAMDHARILDKVKEDFQASLAEDLETFEKGHSQAIGNLVDQLFVLLGPLLTEKVMRERGHSVQRSPSSSPQPEITLGQAIADDESDDIYRVPGSDSEEDEKRLRQTKERGNLTRSRTIDFEDVYQDGKPNNKQLIVRYPETHGHFYVLHCDDHDMQFNGPNALARGASHLAHPAHGGRTQGHRAVVRKFGVLVLGCSDSLAKKNNALLSPKSPRCVKRKPSFMQEQNRKRQRASSVSSRRRQSCAAEEGPSRRQSCAGNETEAAHRPDRPARTSTETTPPVTINPVPGEIYFTLLDETRSYVPAMILPMENLEAVDISGSLSSLGLMNDVPECLVHNLDTDQLDWAEGTDEGNIGSQRPFPVIYLTSTKFPEGCPTAWVEAGELQEWDLSSNSPALRMNEYCKIVKNFLRRRRLSRSAQKEPLPAGGEVVRANSPSIIQEETGEVMQAASPSIKYESPAKSKSRSASIFSEKHDVTEETTSPLVSHKETETIEIFSSSEDEHEPESRVSSRLPSVSHETPDELMDTAADYAVPNEEFDGVMETSPPSVDPHQATPEVVDATSPLTVLDDDFDESMEVSTPSVVNNNNINELIEATPPLSLLDNNGCEEMEAATPSTVLHSDIDEANATESPSMVLNEDDHETMEVAPLSVDPQEDVDELMDAASPSAVLNEHVTEMSHASPPSAIPDEEIGGPIETPFSSVVRNDEVPETTSLSFTLNEDIKNVPNAPSPSVVLNEYIDGKTDVTSSSALLDDYIVEVTEIRSSSVALNESFNEVTNAPTPSAALEEGINDAMETEPSFVSLNEDSRTPNQLLSLLHQEVSELDEPQSPSVPTHEKASVSSLLEDAARSPPPQDLDILKLASVEFSTEQSSEVDQSIHTPNKESSDTTTTPSRSISHATLAEGLEDRASVLDEVEESVNDVSPSISHGTSIGIEDVPSVLSQVQERTDDMSSSISNASFIRQAEEETSISDEVEGSMKAVTPSPPHDTLIRMTKDPNFVSDQGEETTRDLTPSTPYHTLIGTLDEGTSAADQVEETARDASPPISHEVQEAKGTSSHPGSQIIPSTEVEEATKPLAVAENTPVMDCSRASSVSTDIPMMAFESYHDDDLKWQSSKEPSEEPRELPNTSERPLATPSEPLRVRAATSEDPFLTSPESTPAPEVSSKASEIEYQTHTNLASLPTEQDPTALLAPANPMQSKLPNTRVSPSIADLLTTNSDDTPCLLQRPIPDRACFEIRAEPTRHTELRRPNENSRHYMLIPPAEAVSVISSPETEKQNPQGKYYPQHSELHAPSAVNSPPTYSTTRSEGHRHLNTPVIQNACPPSLHQLVSRVTRENSSQNKGVHTITHYTAAGDSLGIVYSQKPAIATNTISDAHAFQGPSQSLTQHPGWQPTQLASPPSNYQAHPSMLQEEARQALKQMDGRASQPSMLDHVQQARTAFHQGLPTPASQPAVFPQKYCNHHDRPAALQTPATASVMTRRPSYDHRAPISPTDSHFQYQSAFSSPRPQPLEPHAFSAGPKGNYGNQQSGREVQNSSPQQSPPPVHRTSFTPHNSRDAHRSILNAPVQETNRTRSDAATRMISTPSSTGFGQGVGAHDLKWTAVSQAVSSAPWLVTPPGGAHEQVRKERRSGPNDYKVNIQSMRSALNTYVCDYCPPRNKKHYQTAGWMKKHLELIHGVAARSMI